MRAGKIKTVPVGMTRTVQAPTRWRSSPRINANVLRGSKRTRVNSLLLRVEKTVTSVKADGTPIAVKGAHRGPKGAKGAHTIQILHPTINSEPGILHTGRIAAVISTLLRTIISIVKTITVTVIRVSVRTVPGVPTENRRTASGAAVTAGTTAVIIKTAGRVRRIAAVADIRAAGPTTAGRMATVRATDRQAAVTATTVPEAAREVPVTAGQAGTATVVPLGVPGVTTLAAEASAKAVTTTARENLRSTRKITPNIPVGSRRRRCG